MRETTRTFGNGLVTTKTYRADNLTESIDTPGVTSFAYTYDENKNKTSESIGGVMAGYGFSTGANGYDAEDRLVGWNRDDGQLNQDWNLSLAGDWQSFIENGVTQNRTHGPAHETTAIAGTPLTYDAKGNLTTNSNGQTYTWDFDNQMTTATVGADTYSYGYDALRRRVTKTVEANTVVFVSLTMEFQRDSLGQVIAEYVTGASSVDPDRKYAFAAYIDEPILLADSTGPTDQVYYYHRDNHYSVVALSDSVSTVVERISYSAYGKATFLNADGTLKSSQQSSVSNSYAFTGRRLDHETLLYYFRARYFDATLGFFIGRDPIGFRDGPNLYCFLIANPVRHLDASGQAVQFGIIAVLVAITCGSGCLACLASVMGLLPPGQICNPVACGICGACLMGICVSKFGPLPCIAAGVGVLILVT